MRIAQRAEAVELIEQFAAGFRLLGLLERNRLSAAADTAARTCHDFHEIIVCLSGKNGFDQTARIGKAAGNRTADNSAVHVKFRFAPALLSADCAEGIRCRVRADNRIISGAQGSFHNAAGCAEDDAGTRTDTERGIEFRFGQAGNIDIFRTDQAVHFARRERDVHILNAVGLPDIHVPVLFRLLGEARHDGNTADFLRRDADLLGKITLRDSAKHLLRALRRRQIRHKLRVLRFEEAHPARAAGGEHRIVLEFSRGEALEEFGCFLHDGQVSGERGVEDIIKAHRPQCGSKAAHRCQLARQAERFAPGGTNCRCDLDNRDLVRICQRVEHFNRVVALTQCADRAVRDALPAQGTVRFLDAAVIGDVDGGTASRTGHFPDAERLDLFTVLHAAHALDALFWVAEQREGGRPQSLRQILRVWIAQNAEIIGYML